MPDLSNELCRARQHRLREAMQQMNAERVILTSPENVQWLTGFRPHYLMSAVASLEPNGDCILIAYSPSSPADSQSAMQEHLPKYHSSCCMQDVLPYLPVY